MAKLGGIELGDSTTTHQSGAALLLNKSPSDNHTIQVDQDWEVELEKDNPYVVARGTKSLGASDVLSPSHGAIQQALDLLSFQNDGDYTCRDVDQERIIWWRESGDQHLRVVNVSPFGVSTSTATTTVSGSGSKPASQPPQPTWHESLRYFRLAQTTEDLFDAYRNMYLALEMILSDRDPQKRSEGERKWFERALKNAHNQLDLSKFAPNPKDVVDSIVQQQYYDTRVKLFHSKKGRSKLLPHNEQHRQQVQDALENLSPMTVHIMRNTLNVPRKSGVMTHAGFELMMDWMTDDQNIEIRVSKDGSSLSPKETLSSSPWANSEVLSTSYASSLSRPGLRSALAQEDTSNISGKTIQRIGLTNDQNGSFELFSIYKLEAELDIDGIDRFEAQTGIVLRNDGTARTRFSS